MPTLRSPGILNIPSTAPAGAPAVESGLLLTSRPPRATSSFGSRTPRFAKPVSAPSVRALCATAAVAAFVSSAPAWHVEHCPLPVKTFMPSTCCFVSALWSPERNSSTGVWSETSEDSYSWTARPQKREKFACSWVISFDGSAPVGAGTNVWLAPGFLTTRVEPHQRGAKACSIRSAYETRRPLPDASAYGPRTLSLVLTFCSPSGCSEVSLRAMSGQPLPANDMTPAFVIGPTACDASEAFGISRRTGWSWPGVGASSTFAPGVRSPQTLTPLKTFCALPSHCWRKLNVALITVGALRGVTCRTFTPPTEKTLSGTGAPASAADPGITWSNLVLTMLCEPTTFFVSASSCEAALSGSASLCVGKSAAAS